MINAINSNLISLLWAQTESIVPTLWLCTWLCLFFILPLFICCYYGLQDVQCRWHGMDVQTKLAERVETWPTWRWIQGCFEGFPVLPVSRSCSFVLQHFCTEDVKMCLKCNPNLNILDLLSSYYPFSFNILKYSIKTSVKESELRSVQAGSTFYWLS